MDKNILNKSSSSRSSTTSSSQAPILDDEVPYEKLQYSPRETEMCKSSSSTQISIAKEQAKIHPESNDTIDTILDKIIQDTSEVIKIATPAVSKHHSRNSVSSEISISIFKNTDRKSEFSNHDGPNKFTSDSSESSLVCIDYDLETGLRMSEIANASNNQASQLQELSISDKSSTVTIDTVNNIEDIISRTNINAKYEKEITHKDIQS